MSTNGRDDRDDELNAWLSALNQTQPTGAQIRHWKAAIRSRRRRSVFASPQLAAALVVGFLLGLGVFSLRERVGGRDPAGNFDPSATVEVVFDKGQ